MAVTVIELPGEPKEKPVEVQPVRSGLGPLSLTKACSSLLTVAPPPMTKVPRGQFAVAEVPLGAVLEIETVATAYCTLARLLALTPVSVVPLIWVPVSEPGLICFPVRLFALSGFPVQCWNLLHTERMSVKYR
jgi:hypothetical protein